MSPDDTTVLIPVPVDHLLEMLPPTTVEMHATTYRPRVWLWWAFFAALALAGAVLGWFAAPALGWA